MEPTPYLLEQGFTDTRQFPTGVKFRMRRSQTAGRETVDLGGLDGTPENTLSTIEKAHAFNLDPLKYGTVVEIGAGQEVARWFFRAGAAAGTIAKTMSAYDMNFSDEIYGKASDRRYVSRPRLERMLEQEFDLVVARVEDHRPPGSRFFAFADTVAARGFKTKDECHGWLGVRLQMAPKALPEDVILHVRMLDDTNVEQQEALGILGVNLIHGAFSFADTPKKLVRRLMDNLKPGRVEIDLIEFRGPTLGAVDNRLMALELVKANLTTAVMFDPSCRIVIAADAFYKQSVLALRGRFRKAMPLDMERVVDAGTRFLEQDGVTDGKVLRLAEITMAKPSRTHAVDTADFLARITNLTANGFHVLISQFPHYFHLRQHLAHYCGGAVGLILDRDGLAEIFREENYADASGGILECLGLLFPKPTVAFVYPNGGDGGQTASLDEVPIAGHLKPLLAYLRERGCIVGVGK